jgi:hypothetical protein
MRIGSLPSLTPEELGGEFIVSGLITRCGAGAKSPRIRTYQGLTPATCDMLLARLGIFFPVQLPCRDCLWGMHGGVVFSKGCGPGDRPREISWLRVRSITS